MVAKGVILRGIEDLQEGRRRVATEIRPKFVHLVEHKHGVRRSRLMHALHNAPGQRPHVRAPVTTDFCLVPDATQGETHEFAP